jgi:hypothetical protein
MTAPAQHHSQIRPLDEFYVRGGRPLLEFAAGRNQIQPYRPCWYTERDMTRTLEQFHAGTIHLRVLSSYREGKAYWRESVLELDGSNRPVELGRDPASTWSRFPEPWRALDPGRAAARWAAS